MQNGGICFVFLNLKNTELTVNIRNARAWYKLFNSKFKNRLFTLFLLALAMSVILQFYLYYLSMDKNEEDFTWHIKNPSMEFLKDKKILSKDKKILSMDKNFLSINFIHQYHLYLQCDMQNWRITFPSMDKKILSFNIILQFCISHCKYKWIDG